MHWEIADNVICWKKITNVRFNFGNLGVTSKEVVGDGDRLLTVKWGRVVLLDLVEVLDEVCLR